MRNQDCAWIAGSPGTMAPYNRLNPYEKQDGLICKFGDLAGPKKPGDGGMDGDRAFRLGMDEAGETGVLGPDGEAEEPGACARAGRTIRAEGPGLGFES